MALRRRIGLCPCGAKAPYLRCCARFISGESLPDTPGELMRSRYTAYAFGDADYIIATTDREGVAWQSDGERWRAGVLDFGASCEFLGVTVLDETVDGDHGVVRFRAQLRKGRDDASFAEKSRFVRRGGCWLYSDGVTDN